MTITKEEAEEIDIVKYINNQKQKKKEKICLQTQLKKQKEK
jgi:hypothetical protein